MSVAEAHARLTGVENVQYDHPDVMDAAIVGIPRTTLGEEVGAVVRLKPGGRATEGETA